MNITKVSVAHRHTLASAKESIISMIHGVIELITNVDDSYERKNGLKRKYSGKCTLKYSRGRNNPSIIEISDRAEGMTSEKLKSSMDIGEYNSAGSGRGFVGVGLKETSAHGEIKIQTIKDNKYSEATFNLGESLNLNWIHKDSNPNDQQRNDLGVSKPNHTGTKVTWKINPDSTIEHTKFENLIKRLETHFMLRPILQKGSKTLLLNMINGNTGFEKVLEYNPPKVVKNIFDEKIQNKEIDELNKYFGTNHDVRFVLNEIEDNHEELSEYSNHGILIQGSKQIFELGFLNRQDKNSNSILKKYSGYLKTSLFDEALKDFRYDEKAKDPKNNPSRIFDPSRRRGIKYNHPIIQKITNEARSKLDRFLKSIENSSNKTISVNKKMLNKLQDFFADSMKELDETFSENDRKKIEELSVDKFRVIGPDLYPQEERNIYVYTHIDTIEDVKKELVLKINEDCKDYINIIKGISKPQFDKQFADRAVFKFKLEGISPKNGININFHFKGKEYQAVTSHIINVKDYQDRNFISDIEFGAKNYGIRKGSKRTIELFAKYPDIANDEIEVEVYIDDNSIAKLNKDRVLLKRFKNTNYLFGEIIAEGLSDTGNTKITAECNDNFAVSNIKITQKDERSNHDYKISIVDAEFGEERYRWKDNLLEIFAKHKTCNSVFENKSEIQSLGSGKKIHTKLFFAELFSHAIAWKYMDTFIDKRSEELVSLMEGEIVGTFEKYNMIQRKFHNDVSKLMFEDEDGFLSLAS